MYDKFKIESIPLSDIHLDERNPRIVTQKRLSSQTKILEYLFEHEDLESFIKKVATQGKNRGAEMPYVVKAPNGYTVIEGNTRIAAYKILTGLHAAPAKFAASIPRISAGAKKSLLTVECSVAPSRDDLLPIMANAHFGRGDKSKWGYLGSRKAVYDEWKAGKSVAQLAKAFEQTKSKIQDFILEYCLYMEAIKLRWSPAEKEVLLDPAVEFNPPVRFLESRGHKEKVGVGYDTVNMAVTFNDALSYDKFKHLIERLVIKPRKGLGATASYNEVFVDFAATPPSKKPRLTSKPVAVQSQNGSVIGPKSGASAGSVAPSAGATSAASSPRMEAGALFSYQVTINDAVIKQLMKEAQSLNGNKFPSAATFLLRNIIESILKHLIHVANANPSNKLLDIASSIGLCLGSNVNLPPDDRKVLKEFQRQYLDYLNLGAHGNVVPNSTMLFGARDCIDQFIKRNV